MKTKILLAITAISLMLFSTTAIADTHYSDTTTEWSSDGTTWYPTYATWVHPSWPSISGATWIWRTTQTNPMWEYDNVPDGGWYFRKTFDVCSEFDTGTLWINADNTESAYINGIFLGQDGPLNKDGPDGYEWRTIKDYDLTPHLTEGQNTLLVRALNYFRHGSYTSNPAGLSFKIEIDYSDQDNDGLTGCEDMCSETGVDEPDVRLGTNRWIVVEEDGELVWTTKKPKGKGWDKSFDIEDTHGCSCEQILTYLHETYPEEYGEMKGHWKFGCSISVLEDFIDLTG